MARNIMAIQDRHGSVDRSRSCTPSDLIVHYFLDDLSTTEKKDLSDHFSRCDLCSARLLALEISAEVGVGNMAGDSNPKAMPARRSKRWRRNRPAARVTVVSLEGRELKTTMTLPVDFLIPTSVAAVAWLDATLAVPHADSRRYNACGHPGDGSSNPRLWDLAIRELYEAA
jgi:hypothetical protein